MLSNPIEAYLQAAQMANANQRQMYQDIAGAGQGIGQIGQGIGAANEEARKKQIVQQLVYAMQQPKQVPIQGPQQMGPISQEAMSSQPGQMTDNPAADVMGPMTRLYPQEMAKSMMPMNRLQESEIFKNYATGMGKSGVNPQATTTLYRNPQNGDVSDQPNDGWVAYQVKPGQALQTLINGPLAKERADAQKNRTEAWNRSIDTKQIDSLAKSTGLHPTVVRQLQVNNLRADRALAILNDPRANWAALNGWVSTDFAGIMQGGAPQKEQILESQFPNWRAKISQIRTYVGSEPKGAIPEGFRDYMRHFITGVKDIDNEYLQKNAQFQQTMLGPTIRGGNPYVQKSKDFTADFIKGPSGKSAGTIKVKNFTVTK